MFKLPPRAAPSGRDVRDKLAGASLTDLKTPLRSCGDGALGGPSRLGEGPHFGREPLDRLDVVGRDQLRDDRLEPNLGALLDEGGKLTRRPSREPMLALARDLLPGQPVGPAPEGVLRRIPDDRPGA